jgi:hypothetical protein
MNVTTAERSKENRMENVTIETTKPAVDAQPGTTKTKAKKTSKRGKVAKKATPANKNRAKKDTGTPQSSNKKAEVITLMKRAKGATLSEIVESTGWQKHTVRGFVSILGSSGGAKIESSKNAAGERTYRIAK